MRKYDNHANYIGYLDGVPNRNVYISIELRMNRSGQTQLSISGQAGDGSCGQIDMHIKPEHITPSKKCSKRQIEELWSIWDQYHLNDMKVINGDTSRWGYIEIPQDVIRWLKSNFTVKDSR